MTEGKKTEVIQEFFKENLGEITELEIRLDLQVVEVQIDTLPGKERLLQGEVHNDDGLEFRKKYVVDGNRGVLSITQRGDYEFLRFIGRPTATLDLDIPRDLTTSLHLDLGVGRTDIDLSDVTLKALKINGGVGETRITLPRTGQASAKIEGGVGKIDMERASSEATFSFSKLHVEAGVGAIHLELPAASPYSARVEAGVGSVVIELPESFEGRIRSEGGLPFLRSAYVTHKGFRHTGQGEWQTDNYRSSEAGVDLLIQSGIGDVRVV